MHPYVIISSYSYVHHHILSLRRKIQGGNFNAMSTTKHSPPSTTGTILHQATLSRKQNESTKSFRCKILSISNLVLLSKLLLG